MVLWTKLEVRTELLNSTERSVLVKVDVEGSES
jgi:hypothetical protein